MLTMIEILIDANGSLRVENDTPTQYDFSSKFNDLMRHEGDYKPADERYIGEEIFTNIFHTGNRIKLLENALNSSKNLTLKIVAENEIIHNIPYELMYSDSHGGYLLKNGKISLLRDIPESIKNTQTTSREVLKILIVIALPLAVYKESPLDPLVELEMLYDALESEIRDGRVDIDVLVKSGKNEIRKALNKNIYDIVYFSGHGSEGGYLALEDDTNNHDGLLVSAEEIAHIFAYKPDIKLFIFNACESAKSSLNNPSLAYHAYKVLPNASIIANTYSVYDHIAAETMKHFFESFKNNFNALIALENARVSLNEEWFKPVLYAKNAGNIFDIRGHGAAKEITLNNVQRDYMNTYVFRYTLTREAADLIENGKYLVLHGIGGTGKSTMARYMARFFAGKFSHTLFFDLKEYESPLLVVDTMLDIAEENSLVSQAEIDNIEQFEEIKRLRKKIKLFFEKVKGRVFFILDNLESYAQDENGILKREWAVLVNTLLEKDVFILFTSRLKVFSDRRTPYDNILTIGEYEDSEIEFLLYKLNRNHQAETQYLETNLEEIREYFGFHPLALSQALQDRPANITSLFDTSDFKEYFDYYRIYFEKYPQDSKKLFSLEGNELDKTVFEKYMDIDFVNLLKTDLLLLRESDTHYIIPPVIYNYFKKDYFDPDMQEELEKRIEEMSQKNLSPGVAFDLLKIKLNRYTEENQNEVEEENIIRLFEVAKRMNFTRDSRLMLKTLEAANNFSNQTNKGYLLQTIGDAFAAQGAASDALSTLGRAIESYDQALGLNPNYTDVYNNKATALLTKAQIFSAQGDASAALSALGSAIESFDQALGLNPNYTDVYNNKATALLTKAQIFSAQGDASAALSALGSAIESFDQALGLNPNYTEAYSNKATALLTKAEILAAKGAASDALSTLGSAIESYDQALGLNPNYTGAYSNKATAFSIKARILAAQGAASAALSALGSAIESYDQALGLNPNLTEAYNNKANVLLTKAQILAAQGAASDALRALGSAIESYDQALGLNPNYTKAYNNKATVLVRKAEILAAQGAASAALSALGSAIESFDQALGLNPNYTEAYNNKATALLTKAEILAAQGAASAALSALGSAIESFNQALGLNPNLTEAYNNKANVLLTKAQILAAQGAASDALRALGSAIESYDQALELNPNYAEAYSNKATAFSRKAQILAAQGAASDAFSALGSAIESYDQALGLNPNYTGAYNNKATALLTKAEILATQGEASAALSALGSAIESYDQALGLNPNLTEAYNNKANVLLKKAEILSDIKESTEETYHALKATSEKAITSLLAHKSYGTIAPFYLRILLASAALPTYNDKEFWETVCKMLEFVDKDRLPTYAKILVEADVFGKINISEHKDRIILPLCKKSFESFLVLIEKAKMEYNL